MSKTTLDNIVTQTKTNSRSRSKLLNIGIDIDNTLFNLPIIEYINKTYNENYKERDIRDWEFSNFPEHIRNDILAQFKNPEFMCRLRSIYGTYQTIRDWHSVGHRIYLITKRDLGLRNETESQIHREFPGIISDVAFVGNDDKKAALKYYRINLFIHDYHVEDSLDLNIPTWMITNESTHYNHSKRADSRLSQAAALRHVRLFDDSRAIIH